MLKAPAAPGSPARAREEALIKLGDAEIERIIAGDLTRGQIRVTFGVGEHAAQLARTQAVAVARDRRRRTGAPDAAALRELAEEYLTQDAGRLGTTRSKVTLFLDWLESRSYTE